MAQPHRQHRPRPHTTVVRKRPQIELSVTGLVFCTMMMFMGMAAMTSQANLLFGVFGLMMGTLLVSGIISRIVLRKLAISRVSSDGGVVGQPISIRYAIQNRKRFWPSLSVTVAELDGAEAFTKQPLAFMIHTPPRGTSTISAELIAKRRGLHKLSQYQCITSFPFGFIKRSLDCNTSEAVLIYPAIGQLDKQVLRMCRSAESVGMMLRPRAGGSDEFYGVREYRAGENPRWIYWRRSARTGTLVTREMTKVSPPRILLLVDTFLPDRTIESHAAVERAIAMAATVASEAIQQGLPVGMTAWSDEWLHIAPNRGKRHRRDLLTALARLKVNTEHDHRDLMDTSYRHRKSGTTVMLVTPNKMQMSLGESARGGFVVLSADAHAMSSWFKFEDSVNFACCMPIDQQASMQPGGK